jgi:hypothetical protein
VLHDQLTDLRVQLLGIVFKKIVESLLVGVDHRLVRAVLGTELRDRRSALIASSAPFAMNSAL